MSGIRGSMVLLLMLVLVISYFSMQGDKPEIRPGESDPGARIPQRDSSTQQKPPETDSTISQDSRESTRDSESVQSDPARDDDPPKKETHEVLLRVMNSLGEPVEPGLEIGLFESSGEPLASAEPVLKKEVQGIVVGGFRSPETGLERGTPRVPVPPTETGRWVIDATLQDAAEDLLTIGRMILVRPDSTEEPSLLVIPARTRAPVGSRLRIQVKGDGRTLDGGILKVTGEENLWQLPLVPRQWYAGLLKVEVVWSWEAATVERQNQVLEIRGAEFSGKDWDWSGTLSVDTSAEAKRQGEKIRRWYRQLLDEVEMTRDLLLVAGAHARGKRAKLVRDDERYSKLLTHPLAPVLDDLGRGSGFDERRWRKLLDEELPQRWSPWVQEGAIPWPDRYPGPARNVPLLFHTLVKYSRLESTVIYLALGKERHPNDFVADFDWDPATERTQTLGKLRNFINAIREKLSELDGD